MSVIAPIIPPLKSRKVDDSWARVGCLCGEFFNNDWLDSLNYSLVEKFDEAGYDAITQHCFMNHGTNCFVTSRKYPNLFSTFLISDSHRIEYIKWTYYLNEGRFFEFEVGTVMLFSMLGILPPEKIKCGLFKTIYKPLMTTEQFDGLLEAYFIKNNITPTPYKFIYMDKDSGLYFDLDKNTDWFEDYVIRYYYTIKDFKAVKTKLCIDSTQLRLLNLFKKSEI